MEVLLRLHRLTGMETDAHAQRCLGVMAAVLLDGPLNQHRAPNRLDRAGEGGHDPVAEGLHLPAVVGIDRAPKQAEVDPAEILGGIVPEAGE